MGLFGTKIRITDRIWLNESLKEHDILNTINLTLRDHHIPLCLFHFHDSGNKFKLLLLENKLRVHSLNSVSELDTATPDQWRRNTDVLLMDSDLITRNDLKHSRKRTNQSINFRILLLERYPVPEPDDRVLAFANARKDITAPTAFVALDTPWLQTIMGDRFKAVYENLGMDEHEVITHTLITKSIRSAQEKMAQKIVRDFPHDTLEGWLTANLKS